MSDRPTPETDAACWRSGLQGHGTVDDCDPELCYADFARRLERERDEARGAIKSTIAWLKERRNAPDFTTMGMVEERLLKALGAAK